MTWSVCTLLFTAVALMASRASVPAGPDSEHGRAATRTLTRFVFAKCSETGQLSSRGLFHSRAAVHRHIAALRPCSAAAQPTWVSGKFKSMSGPVTSWPEPGARLDPRRTSDTSQKVPCDASVGFSVYIPCNNHRYHHGIYAGSVVV